MDKGRACITYIGGAIAPLTADYMLKRVAKKVYICPFRVSEWPSESFSNVGLEKCHICQFYVKLDISNQTKHLQTKSDTFRIKLTPSEPDRILFKSSFSSN